MDLTSGDFQEWQVGVELNVPIGFRQGAAAVRNAELQLTRARAVLREQEHLVLHDAATPSPSSIAPSSCTQTAGRRLDAARHQLDAVEAAYDADKAPLDLVLEAQRRLADAESRYYQALAEYAIAIKNVHFAKGTLLDYDGVVLAESAWPDKAYADAAERDRLRGRPRVLNYASARQPVVGGGTYDQHSLEPNPLGLGFRCRPSRSKRRRGTRASTPSRCRRRRFPRCRRANSSRRADDGATAGAAAAADVTPAAATEPRRSRAHGCQSGVGPYFCPSASIAANQESTPLPFELAQRRDAEHRVGQETRQRRRGRITPRRRGRQPNAEHLLELDVQFERGQRVHAQFRKGGRRRQHADAWLARSSSQPSIQA